jgi:hypothetical protein
MSTVTMPRPTADHSQKFAGLFREHYLLAYPRSGTVAERRQPSGRFGLQTLNLTWPHRREVVPALLTGVSAPCRLRL